jgi:Fe-Mn family superoxide dismutase
MRTLVPQGKKADLWYLSTEPDRQKVNPMTLKIDRRALIGAGATTMAAMALARGNAAAQNAPSAARVPYEIKPLPFAPDSIAGLSERILVSHHDNNYAGSVRRLNAISEQLSSLDFETASNFTVNGLKHEEIIAMNSVILHELYFDGLGLPGEPQGMLADAIVRDFGGFDRWRTEFSAMGRALGGGSGWVLLSLSPLDGRLGNHWAADHTMTLAGGRPILALDMYEHSYHMDYGTMTGAYVEAYMNAINWENVATLYGRYAAQG